MKTKFLKFISVLFIVTWPLLMQSQTIVTTAGSPSECPGDIVVPITVTNCNGVGAISLVLQFNTGILTYMNYENVHSDLSTGLLIVNQTEDKVIVSWASTTAANIGSGKLMDIRFSGVTGSSSLVWDTQTSGNCEYSDANGSILLSSYTNGTTTVYQVPEILNQPTDVTALVDDNVSFTINAIATGISREWFRSTDAGSNWYSTGITSATLNISDVTLDMEGYLYRCEISGTCSPIAISDAAELTVIQPLITSFDIQEVCPGNITIPILTSNFSDVASLSLAFSYNTSTLTYSGFQNANTLLPGNFVCNEVGGMVYMSWSGTSPVTFGTDTTLVEIQFTGTTGTSNLTWDLTTPGNCEYIYLNVEEIVFVFQNNAFTIYQVPQINMQPIDKLIPENTATNFSISAIASGITYHWQISTDGGSLWTNLMNIGIYNGVTSSTLNISSGSLSMSGHLYRCVVSGNCTPEEISDPAELIVLPRITAIAGIVSDCPGTITVPIDVTHFIDVAAFSLTLNFDEAILTFDNYQTLNSSISGGNFTLNAVDGMIYITWTSTTPVTIGDDLLIELLFTGVTGSSSLNWNNNTAGACEFSDVNGNIIFDNYVNGNITVYQPPGIISNPTDQTAPSGTGTSFAVFAAGTGLGYLWQLSYDNGNTWFNLTDAAPYSGVFTATLQINPVDQTMDDYQYRCMISGTCPTVVYSSHAVLNVMPAIIYTSALDVPNSCTGNITVPIVVNNFYNVGAISLALNYNNTLLTFEGYQLVNSKLSGGIINVNTTATQIILTWASVNPADIGFGTLFALNFKANGGISTNLVWDTQIPGNCEYSDPDGNIFATSFSDAQISIATNAVVVDAGNDQIIAPLGSVELNGSATGGTEPYTIQWTPINWLSNPNILDPMANPTGTTIYTLMVTDNLGCSGSDEMTVTVATAGIDLDLKVFLEGPFSGTEMTTRLNNNGEIPFNHPYSVSPWNYTGSEYVTNIPNSDITDWVVVELRETSGGPLTATSETIVEQRAGFILNNGNIVGTDGANMMHFDVLVTQNIYVVIRHRNHLAIMSSALLTNSGPVYTWDFTTGAGQAYGTNAQKNLGSGIYGMYTGDGDANDIIELADKNSIWASQVGLNGYYSADFDMNGQVDNQDKNDVWLKNNNTNSQIP